MHKGRINQPTRTNMKILATTAVIAITLLVLFSGVKKQERSECQRWAAENYTSANVASWQVEQCDSYHIAIIK